MPWEYVDKSTGRWDDPQGQYRVMYAGSTPEACFAEVLAQFRPDPMLVQDTTAVGGDPRDDLYPTVPLGVLPSSWLEHRRSGTAILEGTFVDIGHKETIAALRPKFLAEAVRHGLADFDAAAIRVHRPRRLTQGISRHLYESGIDGEPIAGIRYESRFGAELDLWAIFERAEDEGLGRSRLLGDVHYDAISSTHEGLADAMRLHGLELG